MPRSDVLVVAAFSLLVLVLVAAGCGPRETQAEDASTDASPRSGGVLRLLYEIPASLDPADVTSVYESLPVNQLFDGLVANDPSLSVVPALATSWTISRDGRIYTFKLRRGVRFHDGAPLTAADVVFTFERVLAPERRGVGIASSYLSVVEGASDFTAGRTRILNGVRALGPDTVEVRLTRPYLSFLEVIGLDELRIVPRSVLEARGDASFDRAPVGTGPFRFERWTADRVRLAPNPDYWGGAPHVEALEILFRADDERDHGTERFLRREVDVLEPAFDQLDPLAKGPRTTTYRYQELSLSFLGLNTGHPAFSDLRIRRAIAHAIDRRSLATLSPATRRPADGILPPGLPGYSPKPRALAYDPERARELLAEAGHPGGAGLEPIPIYFAGGSTASVGTIAKVRSDLEAVGFRVDPREVPWAELSRRTMDHDARAFLLGWIADLADPDAFLRTLFEPGGSANYFDFVDERAARLLDAGAREMNPIERARLYGELESRILEEAPIVPLFHAVGIVVHDRAVQGLKPGPLGLAAVDFEKVWLDREPLETR